ncbi:hypothetical protein AHAS_Ahas13G0342200 [Arachis hypogaea]
MDLFSYSESLADSCFPVNDGPAASRLHAALEAGNLSPERDEKGNSTVEAHLSNWQKEKTILMDRSVAFGSSRFSQTFRIHRSLLIYDSGYCTPNSAIGECSWRRRARKTAKFAPYFTCLFLVPLIMDATPLANMQTFPPSNARGRRGQVYQPITAQTAESFEQQPTTNWLGVFSVSSYSQYFNVETDVVVDRMICSLNPVPDDFFSKIDANPDF